MNESPLIKLKRTEKKTLIVSLFGKMHLQRRVPGLRPVIHFQILGPKLVPTHFLYQLVSVRPIRPRRDRRGRPM